MNLIEVWKDVVGFEGYYEVSNTGRVRSLDRETKRTAPTGKVYMQQHTGRELRQKRDMDKRYDTLKRMLVSLYKHGVRYDATVHSLVMAAFVGPCPKGMEIAHNTSDPSQNSVHLLRYCTHKENCQDRVGNGTEAIGERNPAARLKEVEVRAIRSLADTMSKKELAAQFSIDRRSVQDIISRSTWRHVP